MFGARSVVPQKDAPDSICPSGWHLPSSTGTSSYTTLVQNYVGREDNNDADNNYNTMQLNVLGFTRPGDYSCNDGSLYNQSSGGFYWSRTRNGTTDAYRLYFYSTRLYPRYNYDRGYGFTLRCLAR